MAQQGDKISEMPELSQVSGKEYAVVVDGKENKKVRLDKLKGKDGGTLPGQVQVVTDINAQCTNQQVPGALAVHEKLVTLGVEGIKNEDLDTLTKVGVYQRYNTVGLGLTNTWLLIVANGAGVTIQLKINIQVDGIIHIEKRTKKDGSLWGSWIDYLSDVKLDISNIQDVIASIPELEKSDKENRLNFYIANNYFIEKYSIFGKYLDLRGNEQPNAAYSVSNYIPLTKANPILKSYINNNPNNDGSGNICYYNADKVIIPGKSQTIYDSKGIATWAEGVSYVRFSIKNNGSKNILITFNDGKNLEQKSIERLKKNKVEGFCGTSYSKRIKQGENISLPSTYIRRDNFIAARINGVFTKVRFGYGIDNEFQGWYVEVDTANIYVYQIISSPVLKETLPHGLKIGGNSYVAIRSYDTTAKIVLTSDGNTFEGNIKEWYGGGACAFVNMEGAEIDVKISNNPPAAQNKIWFNGDSYFSYWQKDRWTYYILQWGCKNILLSHIPGGNSKQLYDAFLNALSFGRPNYSVWALGMNDGADKDEDTPDTIWLNYVQRFISICESMGITPILCTIPSVPSKSHEGKNKWIRNSGFRYIDFAKSVGAKPNGEWDSGLIESALTPIHPSVAGAKMLANEVLIDFPEVVV